MLNENTLPNNILKGELLEVHERVDCEVHNLRGILENKYEMYHGRAEEIWILIKYEEFIRFSEDKRKKYLRFLAKCIGEYADQDEDFKKELKYIGINDFYNDPTAIRLKHLLGMLAMENGKKNSIRKQDMAI